MEPSKLLRPPSSQAPQGGVAVSVPARFDPPPGDPLARRMGAALPAAAHSGLHPGALHLAKGGVIWAPEGGLLIKESELSYKPLICGESVAQRVPTMDAHTMTAARSAGETILAPYRQTL